MGSPQWISLLDFCDLWHKMHNMRFQPLTSPVTCRQTANGKQEGSRRYIRSFSYISYPTGFMRIMCRKCFRNIIAK